MTNLQPPAWFAVRPDPSSAFRNGHCGGRLCAPYINAGTRQRRSHARAWKWLWSKGLPANCSLRTCSQGKHVHAEELPSSGKRLPEFPDGLPRAMISRCTKMWYILYMLTNVDIDERLVDTALRLTGERTKRAVIHRALEELVRIERLRALRGARGTLKWEGSLADMREEGTRGTTRRHKRAD